jgi:zinc protease
VHLLYRTVPFGHPDAAALEVLAGLLNGRTGRLHRALVLERGIAFSAFALSNPLRRAGQLSLTAEARGDSSHGELVAALEEELRRLAEEPIAADELTKVKNQITADAFRRLRQPAALMLQLLVYDALGDWRQIETGPARALAVTAADVQRVTRRYVLNGERTVGLFRPRGEATAAAPEAVTGRRGDWTGESR